MQISKFEKIHYIFVDCFDTIILRRCQPEMILTLWFEAISELYGISFQSLYKTWKESNLIVKYRSLTIEEPKFQDIVNEFYSRLCVIGSSLPAYREFEKTLTNLMLNIEYDNSFVNSEIIDILRNQQLEGKRIFCVSDFYLSKDIMENLFTQLGIRTIFDDIFVSSELGLRKSTGNLYKYLIHEMNVKPQSVLMVGDNKHSDYNMPQKAGLKSILYKRSKHTNEESLLYNQLLRIYDHNIAKGLPYANLVFSLFLFCDRLYKAAIENNVNTIHFFSREGEFLKMIFDRYMSARCLNSIKTSYLYISRKSSYLASFKNLKEESFMRLRKQYKALSLSQFVENLCLSDSINDSGLTEKFDMKTVIYDFWNSDIFKDFVQTNEFTLIYDKERLQRKNEIIAYLNQEGFAKESKSCIVDIGWKGTIQDNLHAITEKPILGFYYGLKGDILQSVDNVKKGLMFSTYPYPNEDIKVYGVKYRVFERMLYASHGSCMCYEGGTAILENVNEKEKALYSFASKVQGEMIEELETINSILNASHTTKVLEDVLIRKMHIRYLLDINKSIINQRIYIDDSQKMNAGDENNVLGLKEKMILMLKLARNNREEFLNKLINQMCYHHLYYPAKLISRLSLRRYN